MSDIKFLITVSHYFYFYRGKYQETRLIESGDKWRKVLSDRLGT